MKKFLGSTLVALKTILYSTLSSLVVSCASVPSRQELSYGTEHPCDVVDSGKPLPEVLAEMIYYHRPSYPRLAEQAGLEGTVEVKALVGKDGSVLDAVVARPSGTPSLDESALAAAPKCRFKPALRSGQPICMWVTYKVEFILNP